MATVTYKKSSAHPSMKYGDQKSEGFGVRGSASPEYQQVGSTGTFTSPSKMSGSTFSRGSASPEYQQVSCSGGKMKSGKMLGGKGTVNPHDKSEESYSGDFNPRTTGKNKVGAI